MTTTIQVLRLLAALLLLGILCVVMYVALMIIWEIAKERPWCVVVALPMILAFAWCIWGDWPNYYLRFAFAITVQVTTLVVAALVTR